MIVFHTFVLLHLADGPLWKKIAIQESEYCQKNWWSNFLFINNYVDAEHPVCDDTNIFFIEKKVCIYFVNSTIFSVLFNHGTWRVICNSSS